MTQEDIIKELEAMVKEFGKNSKRFDLRVQNPKDAQTMEYYKGRSHEASQCQFDLSELLTKIKQQ